MYCSNITNRGLPNWKDKVNTAHCGQRYMCTMKHVMSHPICTAQHNGVHYLIEACPTEKTRRTLPTAVSGICVQWSMWCHILSALPNIMGSIIESRPAQLRRLGEHCSQRYICTMKHAMSHPICTAQHNGVYYWIEACPTEKTRQTLRSAVYMYNEACDVTSYLHCPT